MSTCGHLWDFTEHVCSARRQVMLSVTSWASVREIFDERAAAHFGVETRADPCGLGGKGALRASVRLALGEADADIVYNSPVGIRAQYCMGEGCRRNRELIDLVTQKLRSQCGELLTESVLLSLLDLDAKICADSADIPNVDEIHIRYGPWIEQIGRGERLANTGVLAPRLANLWIKGAWILDGEVWRDPLKLDRQEKLKKFGFA
jgi:hypothetical protein